MSISSTVISFVIPKIDSPVCTHIRLFQIKELTEKKKHVVKARSLYEKPNRDDPKRFYYIIRHFEHASTFKHHIHKKFNTPNVSNAWLKAYELFNHYKVFPTKPTDKYVYFDNAAFPGSFILAAHHLVNTHHTIKDFKWYGSSMVSLKERKLKGYLADSYHLYKNYPEKWLMDENNNGDVTVWGNQEQFKKRLGGTVDLYTSDLGFDVSHDYNRQEELHAHANLGQVLTGLLVLKKGGTMITKQYSYFEPFTISLMGIMTKSFKQVEICKPMFSKSGNSETYLVGLGYLGENPEIIDIMKSRLITWNTKPLLTKKCLGNKFISAIKSSHQHLSNMQIVKLTETVAEYKRFVASKNTSRDHIIATNKFKDSIDKDLKSWVEFNNMKKLPSSKKLRVKEVLGRNRKVKK